MVRRVPGIFRRGGRYVVVWSHRGSQHKEYFRTLAEAREAKGRRDSGERRPSAAAASRTTRVSGWSGYAGRTSRGFCGDGRPSTGARSTSARFRSFAAGGSADRAPGDVRRFVRHLEEHGLAPASVVKYLVPLKALFATAVEDGALRTNPTTGIRVNGRRDGHDEEPERRR